VGSSPRKEFLRSKITRELTTPSLLKKESDMLNYEKYLVDIYQAVKVGDILCENDCGYLIFYRVKEIIYEEDNIIIITGNDYPLSLACDERFIIVSNKTIGWIRKKLRELEQYRHKNEMKKISNLTVDYFKNNQDEEIII
jgi:hypothetical protein